MQVAVEGKEWSDEELMALPQDGRKYEVLKGELVVSPTGFQHGYISMRLGGVLAEFVLRRRLGLVVDSSTGFRMKNGDCLSPDVSFVRKERLRSEKGITTRFFQGAPDLVVEVISPGERRRKLREKLVTYFANGTRLAWVINPRGRTVAIYRSATRHDILHKGEQLEGGALLPGFTFPIKELFEIPEFDS